MSAWRLSYRLAALTVLAGLLPAAAACGGGSSTKSSAPTTTTTNPQIAAVLTAWRAAQQAFYQAARSPDPNSPGIAATFAPPELDVVRQNLQALHGQGVVISAPTPDFSRAQVASLSGSQATVRACINGTAPEVFAATGKPVPGPAGQTGPETVQSTVVNTPYGWRVSQQAVTVGPC
jgi:hypothetical protein